MSLLASGLRSCLVVAALALVGCIDRRPYTPENPHAVATSRSSCLEVRATLAADEHLPRSSSLVAFEFENLCRTPIALDWRGAVVTGHRDDGSAVALRLHDPSHRVKLGALDGERSGEEALRFDTRNDDEAKKDDTKQDDDAKDAAPKAPRFARVCVSYGRVTPDSAPPPSVCLDAPGESGIVTDDRAGIVYAHDLPARDPYAPSGSSWDVDGMPRLVLSNGILFHSLGLPGRTFSTNADAFDGGRLGSRMTGWTYDVRLAGFVYGPFYVGGGFGVGAAGSRRLRLDGGEVIGGQPSLLVTGETFAGIATRVGIIQPFLEIGGGGQLLSLQSAAGCTGCSVSRAFAPDWRVTPRAGASLWVHPNLTVDLHAGFDALRSDVGETWFAGVLFSGHVRAFDAR